MNNGSHRAYALREGGHSHVPCLIQTVASRDELEAVGVAELVQRPELYLDGARPPLLRDYFDHQLRTVIDAPLTARQIQVAFGYTQSDVPVA